MWRSPICGARAVNFPVERRTQYFTPHIPARLIGPRHQGRRIDHARRTIQTAGCCRSLSGCTLCRIPRALSEAGARRRILALDAGADRLGAAIITTAKAVRLYGALIASTLAVCLMGCG